ncbi:MAG TPA: hypothetical protein VGM90_06885 [Kofleriaceae bacterium]|jgi:hypothetical protein
MRISWLSPDEIAAARTALTADGATWDSHFTPAFTPPTQQGTQEFLDWPGITEHVARAERVSEVVRDVGLDEARARFGQSRSAIEAATLAAAAHEGEQLSLAQIESVLALPIETYVFYAPFLELLIEFGKSDMDRTLATYEPFVARYAEAMTHVPHGKERLSAVRDGLADIYVFAGKTDEAEVLFEQRHNEDWGDVAVALSASRAFLAAGSISHAVRWLGIAAARAHALGRLDLEKKLREKQDNVRKRLS